MSREEFLAEITDWELQAEAKRRGYRIFKAKRIELLPCVCGRKGPREWFNAKDNGWIRRCEMCGMKSPAAKTKKAAKIAWNEMIKVKRSEVKQ